MSILLAQHKAELGNKEIFKVTVLSDSDSIKPHQVTELHMFFQIQDVPPPKSPEATSQPWLVTIMMIYHQASLPFFRSQRRFSKTRICPIQSKLPSLKTTRSRQVLSGKIGVLLATKLGRRTPTRESTFHASCVPPLKALRS
jgi:hypothetical protein